MTPNGRRPQNIKSGISQWLLIRSSSNFKLKLRGPNRNKKIIVEMKTTSNGRRPQNIKSWISQQPLIGSSSNFKLKLRGPNKNKKCLKWRRPPMEDDLKILKVEYLSRWPKNIKSCVSQQPLIGSSSNFKLKLRGPNQNLKCLKWRRPPMEDDLKILKVEYLSNHWSDLPQILNLSSGD